MTPDQVTELRALLSAFQIEAWNMQQQLDALRHHLDAIQVALQMDAAADQIADVLAEQIKATVEEWQYQPLDDTPPTRLLRLVTDDPAAGQAG